MEYQTLRSKFYKLLEEHDYHMTFHDLRHLSASVMLMLNIPDKYAMERGGWSTNSTLKSVYQHTFSEERKQVDKKIDDYFNKLIEGSDMDYKFMNGYYWAALRLPFFICFLIKK